MLKFFSRLRPCLWSVLPSYSLLLLILFCLPSVWCAESLPDALKGLDVVPKIGIQVPLEEVFLDEAGRQVKLKDFFSDGKPALLVMNYYGCPMLCGLLLTAVAQSLPKIDWTPGDQYKILTISIDPKENSDLAAAKKSSILGSIKEERVKVGASKNWHFLVGLKGSEKRLAESISFPYRWMPEEKQYAHGAAIYFLSPKGKLSRVLLGMEFPARELKLALLEASEGKFATFSEKFLLFCYHYDPRENKYALLASRLMSIGGAVTVAALLVAYGIWFARSRRKGNACPH